MKVKISKEGKIQLRDTLDTMQVGESWNLDTESYSVGYLRVTCSNYGSAVNKFFTVAKAGSSSDMNTIKRLK